MTQHALLLRRPGLALGAVQVLVALASAAWALVGPVASRGTADAVAAVLVGLLALVSLTARETSPRWILEASAAVTAVAIGLTMATRATPQGVVSGGVLLLMLLVAVAMFLPLGRVVAAIALGLVLVAVGLVVNPVPVGGVYVWVLATALIAVPSLVHRLVSELRGLVRSNAEAAVRDPLTGALNRRGVAAAAGSVHAVSDRAGGATAVVALDLDGFKAVNDTRGHAAGDDLLVSLVREWSSVLRAGDILGRTGGDEFVLVLPNCGTAEAEALVARLRAAHPFPWSYGIAEWHADEELDDVVERADERLYLAKPERASVDLRDAERPADREP